MIFLTVGSQLPFDRLTREVDVWAKVHPEIELLAQVGDGGFRPRHMKHVSTMAPDEYQRCFMQASLVVGHAGMGTIIAALEQHKPLLMLPRLAALRESRNDNQVGTARHFAKFQLFEVIDSELDVGATIDRMLAGLANYTSSSDAFGVSTELIQRIREFVSN